MLCRWRVHTVIETVFILEVKLIIRQVYIDWGFYWRAGEVESVSIILRLIQVWVIYPNHIDKSLSKFTSTHILRTGINRVVDNLKLIWAVWTPARNVET